jgi:hypothetical protein
MNPDTSTRFLQLLSRPLLAQSHRFQGEVADLSALTPENFAELLALATSHHVIARTFPRLLDRLIAERHPCAALVQGAMAHEETRIRLALSFLSPICQALQEIGDVIVIKSLDHWPDLGNDLDLYSNAHPSDAVSVLTSRFGARPDERSWGDRLANKWNFIIPGLPELVEVHISRLGQTGEQVQITNSLVERSQLLTFNGQGFRVPAAEDRLMISTLQRMYRHFYLRLCDVADTARLVDDGLIDYPYLKALAQSAGLWHGLASYLLTVSGYVEGYRGAPTPLPAMVRNAAQFGNETISYRRRFLRVPIFPQAVRLYFSEWKRLLLNGEMQSTLRLSLLPGLAAAAALEMKLTGSDKGIW